MSCIGLGGRICPKRSDQRTKAAEGAAVISEKNQTGRLPRSSSLMDFNVPMYLNGQGLQEFLNDQGFQELNRPSLMSEAIPEEIDQPKKDRGEFPDRLDLSKYH